MSGRRRPDSKKVLRKTNPLWRSNRKFDFKISVGCLLIFERIRNIEKIREHRTRWDGFGMVWGCFWDGLGVFSGRFRTDFEKSKNREFGIEKITFK